MPVSIGPCFLASSERPRIAQAFGSNEPLQSREPMLVISRTVIRLTAIGGGLQFIRKRGCPLFPGKMPLLGKFHGERECLRFPRLAKYRPAFVAGQARQ